MLFDFNEAQKRPQPKEGALVTSAGFKPATA